jgi:hypothetical protein
MFIYKALSAIAAAAFGAALVLAIPGFSPEVEAHAPAPAAKSDRLPVQPSADAPTCSQQVWPYFDATCLQRSNSQTRNVRVISTDRVVR